MRRMRSAALHITSMVIKPARRGVEFFLVHAKMPFAEHGSCIPSGFEILWQEFEL